MDLRNCKKKKNGVVKCLRGYADVYWTRNRFIFFADNSNIFFQNPVKVTLPKAVKSCIMKRHIKVPSFCLKVTATVDKGQWRIYHKTFATQTHRGQTAHSTMNHDLAVAVVQPWPDTDFTAPVWIRRGSLVETSATTLNVLMWSPLWITLQQRWCSRRLLRPNFLHMVVDSSLELGIRSVSVNLNSNSAPLINFD